jgi:beta-lactam-binding protein with PASTA domain
MRRSRPVLNFFQVASLMMLLVAVALLAAITTMHFAIHGAEVQVPALKGMTVSDARSQTSGLGLDLDVDNRYYSGDVATGHILTQSPPPGTVVRREWRVRVSESLGPQKVEVPDTVGVDERVAALRLRRPASICWWPPRETTRPTASSCPTSPVCPWSARSCN